MRTAPARPHAVTLVVMGVSGCGKSTVGRGLAQRFDVPYIEGDELHPPENVERMRAGIPLTDDDRYGWLQTIGQRLAQAADRGVVVSCSALKRRYRDQLRAACPGVRFVHLHGSRELLAQRMAARRDHYMPPSLLQSQLDTLEMPGADEAAFTLDIAQPADTLVQMAWQRLTAAPADNPAMTTTASPEFTQVILFTDSDGRARFREEKIALTEGKPMSRLSALRASGGYQFRESPLGFRSEFHCTGDPQWVFILQGQMEIGLQDGSSRVFGPGQHFYSADTLPAGATFDPAVHGHWSRQVGDQPLQTLFVRG